MYSLADGQAVADDARVHRFEVAALDDGAVGPVLRVLGEALVRPRLGRSGLRLKDDDAAVILYVEVCHVIVP